MTLCLFRLIWPHPAQADFGLPGRRPVGRFRLDPWKSVARSVRNRQEDETLYSSKPADEACPGRAFGSPQQWSRYHAKHSSLVSWRSHSDHHPDRHPLSLRSAVGPTGRPLVRDRLDLRRRSSQEAGGFVSADVQVDPGGDSNASLFLRCLRATPTPFDNRTCVVCDRRIGYISA